MIDRLLFLGYIVAFVVNGIYFSARLIVRRTYQSGYDSNTRESKHFGEISNLDRELSILVGFLLGVIWPLGLALLIAGKVLQSIEMKLIGPAIAATVRRLDAKQHAPSLGKLERIS